jgi:hypothetical protein
MSKSPEKRQVDSEPLQVKPQFVEAMETPRKYLIYQCAPSSETRGWRPTHEGGCMKWSVRSTKMPIIGKLRLQAKCRHCGRRPRLDPARIDVFHVKDEALSEASMRNQYDGGHY